MFHQVQQAGADADPAMYFITRLCPVCPSRPHGQKRWLITVAPSKEAAESYLDEAAVQLAEHFNSSSSECVLEVLEAQPYGVANLNQLAQPLLNGVNFYGRTKSDTGSKLSRQIMIKGECLPLVLLSCSMKLP